MRISLNWLNDYIDIKNIPAPELAKSLTALGLEVESQEEACAIKGAVVVGKIIKCERHPNADKLSLCAVDVGEVEPLQIVCGAPNARTGITVAVAKVGAVLPGDFHIKPATIRGVKSFGMLCSEEELGISTNHDGILELDNNMAAGSSILEILGLNDQVFTLGLTPNRSDCLGYIGVARDLAAKLNLALHEPDLAVVPSSSDVTTKDNVTINIEAADDCSRFCALYIKNISPVPSPTWLQKRLASAGMRPINLIVDVTNYVMLEYSHPIHAYDERDIEGRYIGVRRAKTDETLVTLDGVKRALTTDDIVICDKKKAIGLAGVMGGANSEIKPDSQNIIIEVAHFNPKLIRKTAKRTALHSEASHRFERGVDIMKADTVIKRVGALILSCSKELMAQGAKISLPQIAGDIIDNFPVPLIPAKIALRLERVRKILGTTIISRDECIKILSGLGLKLLDKTEERMLFEVPSFRADIEREVDLIEEIARLNSYDKIPYSLPMMEITPNHEDEYVDFIDNIKLALAHGGFNETVSFPFVGASDLDALSLAADHPWRASVHLMNPLVETEGLLTPSATINLIKAVVSNRRSGRKGVRLFEVCRGFYRLGEQAVHAKYQAFEHLTKNGRQISLRARKDQRPIERYLVGGIIDQPFHEKGWDTPLVPATFFHGKSAVLTLLEGMGVTGFKLNAIDPELVPWLHPSRAAMVVAGERTIGYVGELHPKTTGLYELQIDQAPIVFELDIEQIFVNLSTAATYASTVYRFPPITWDLAFVVDKGITYEQFTSTIFGCKKTKHLKHVELFDVYEGPNLPSGKKSMAYTLSFQSAERTLIDKEVEAEVQGLIAWMQEKLGATLR